MTIKNDEAMLTLARMQIILERNEEKFKNNKVMRIDNNATLRECLKIIKKANIPKKYLLAESLDTGNDKS